MGEGSICVQFLHRVLRGLADAGTSLRSSQLTEGVRGDPASGKNRTPVYKRLNLLRVSSM